MLRIGNRSISLKEFNRRRQLLNLFSNQTSDSIKIYDEIKIIISQEYNIMVQLEVVFRDMNLMYVGAVKCLLLCSIGGTIGKEKKEVLSKSIIYSGYRGNIYLSSIF